MTRPPAVSPDVVEVECPDCQGAGVAPTFFNRMVNAWEDAPCRRCGGSGGVPLEDALLDAPLGGAA